jgi:hypothetical protein
MPEELWCHKVDREAGERLEALLALPMPASRYDFGDEAFFDPWSLFPLLYGSYSGEFDECALDVLREIQSGDKVRDDLGAEMFREMLCNLHLCDYGTSPRVCFPTPELRKLLPDFIAKWEAYSAIQWADDDR